MLEKKRELLFDNIRVVLIILVVYGHVIETIRFEDKIFLGIYNFIYLFHMPLFVFCSGAFAKCDKKRIFRKYLIPYIVFQTLYGIFDVYVMKEENFHFLESYYVLWYILALGVWSLVLPLFQGKKNWKKQIMVLTAAILAGLLAGYVEIIGKEFSLSRILVFFPFFLAGYYIKQEDFGKDLIKVFQKMKEKKILQLLCICMLLICFAVVYNVGTGLNTWALYGYTSYAFQGYTVYFRAFQYFAGAGLGLMIFFVISGKKSYVPFLARNTMTIYFIHVPVIKLIEKIEIFDTFKESTIGRFTYSFVMTGFVICLSLGVSYVLQKRKGKM